MKKEGTQMTHTTEQERAEFEKWWSSPHIWGRGHKEAQWASWQAARRAPAAPVPQAPCVICGSDEPYTGTCGSNDHRALCKKPAPQPLEAQAPVSNVTLAAAVQLPEPDAWRYTDARSHFRYRGRRVGFAAEYPLLKPEPLYTEQQVRQLLAEQARND